jgi:hypothetical protein
MRKQGVEIRDEWMRPETLTFKIPSRILEGLGILKTATTMENSFANPIQISRSPTINKSF